MKTTRQAYSHAEMDTFGPWRLWIEFGLHRGALWGGYFYIGEEREKGGLSGQYRMVFFSGPDPELKSKDPLPLLQGPVVGGRTEEDVTSAFQRYVAPVRDYLNFKHTPAPRLKLRNRPGIIDYEDRPDVGAPPKVKPKINFRPREEKTQ